MEQLQSKSLKLKNADQMIYDHIVTTTGQDKPRQIVTDDIADAVRHASSVFETEKQEVLLTKVLDLVPQEDGGAKRVRIYGSFCMIWMSSS